MFAPRLFNSNYLKLIVPLLWFFLFVFNSVVAQSVSVDILQQGKSFDDSAYYDILKVDQNNYWLVGKYGIISNYNINGTISSVNYPSNHNDIYNIDRFDDNNIIACADKGCIYFYNSLTKNWKSKQIEGFENSCFYNIVIIDKMSALICGGRSAIAHSKKAIPNGFIIKTTDGGQTWTKVYSSSFKMVWSLDYNFQTNKASALIYFPNHTTLYSSDDKGSSWNQTGRIGKGIYYDLEYNEDNKSVCYGGKINGSGKLKYYSSNVRKFEKSGLIWSKTGSGNYEIMTACNGNILFSENKENWNLIHTELADRFSLYKAEFINPSQAIIVGSGKTILLLNVNQNLSCE